VVVWYDLPETNQTLNQTAKIQGGLWTGRLNAQQFAEQMQSSITPSGTAATPAS
jgi:hypothetical protein